MELRHWMKINYTNLIENTFWNRGKGHPLSQTQLKYIHELLMSKHESVQEISRRLMIPKSTIYRI